MMRHIVLVFAFLAALAGQSFAQNCNTYPNTLTNGTNADATQVMGNFNYVLGCVRDRLTAARTYYVRTDGNDNCNGLTNAGGSSGNCGFLTIAKALAVVAALDCSTFTATITINAGTWTPPIYLPRTPLCLTPVLTGIGSTTLLSTGSSDAITCDACTPWQVNNVKITTTTGNQLVVRNQGTLKFSGVEFGACSAGCVAHIYVSAGSNVVATGNYTVSGGAGASGYHALAFANANVMTNNVTVTFSAAVTFGTNVAGNFAGIYQGRNMTFINPGNVTAARFQASYNGVVDGGAAGATYFPGTATGNITTGGQYF